MFLAYLHSRKFTVQAKLEKCQAAPPGFEPGTFSLVGILVVRLDIF